MKPSPDRSRDSAADIPSNRAPAPPGIASIVGADVETVPTFNPDAASMGPFLHFCQHLRRQSERKHGRCAAREQSEFFSQEIRAAFESLL
jgi:ribonuclease I